MSERTLSDREAENPSERADDEYSDDFRSLSNESDATPSHDDEPESSDPNTSLHEDNGLNLNLAEAAHEILNGNEDLKRENADLKSQVSQMRDLLSRLMSDNGALQSRLVDISQEKDAEIGRLTSLCQAHNIDPGRPTPTPLPTLSVDQNQLLESKSQLELDNASKTKELLLLKKKNGKLGELLVDRDAQLLRQQRQLSEQATALASLHTCQSSLSETREALQRAKEESTSQTAELHRMRASQQATKESLLRCRQEKESAEKECFRLECALRKSNDATVSLQTQLADATERWNALSLERDDCKRALRLLETTSIDREDTLRQMTLTLESERLQREHWEGLARGETERYRLLLTEFDQLKQHYHALYLRYAETRAESDRLQRQCLQLASEAETARASMLTCKGSLRGAKSLEELLRENAYLSDLLKQKESQMEAAEQQWKQQLVAAVREATEDEDVSTGSVKNAGYSYPLPSNHPFVDTKKTHVIPQHVSAPIEVPRVPVELPRTASHVASHVDSSVVSPSLSPSEEFRTPSEGTLLTQSLNTTKTTDSSLLSFDSLLNDVLRQANQLREVADYYERQE